MYPVIKDRRSSAKNNRIENEKANSRKGGMSLLSPEAQADIREFYSVYNPDKIEMVPLIIAQANTKCMTAPDIFNSLYKKYNIERLSNRLNVILAMKQAHPRADDELILSIVRNLEFKQGHPDDAIAVLRARLDHEEAQKEAEHEAQIKEAREEQQRQQLEIQEKQREQQERQRQAEEVAKRIREEEEASSSSSQTLGDANETQHPKENPSVNADANTVKTQMYTAVKAVPDAGLNPDSKANAASGCGPNETSYGPRRNFIQRDMHTKQTTEAIMGEELRDWLIAMVGDYFDFTAGSGGLLNGGHRLRAESKVCDALRDGAVLAVLQQRLRKPNISVEAIRKPRTLGFFGRENTSIFIDFCRKEYQMRDEVVFTDSDLCDGKNDRMVINCLLAVAAIVYRRALDQEKIQRRAAKEAEARYGTMVAEYSPKNNQSFSSENRSLTTIRAAPKLVVFEDEIRSQVSQTNEEVIEAVVREALEQERLMISQENEKALATTSGTKSNSPSPGASPSRPSVQSSTPADDSPTRDLLVTLQRQREALERQRAVEIEARRKKEELEDLGRIRWEEARRAAKEKADIGIQREKERQLLEVVEMKRQWIFNQMVFLEHQSMDDRNSLEVAEEHTRFRLHDQIRKEIRKLVGRVPSTVDFPSNIPNYKQAADTSAGSGVYAPSPVRHYVAQKGDEIDKKVSRAVNRVFGKHTHANTRIKRLAHAGEYVVFHKITGKKTVVYVRDVRENLMIRVGGGWDDFEGWLERHVNLSFQSGPQNKTQRHL